MKIRSGQRIDRLVTVSLAGKSTDGHLKWLCKCDCGNECVRATNSLRSKAFHSCGCFNGEPQTIHGMRNTREYSSWRSAIYRCENSRSKDYKNYGARGIRMCDEWRFSFESFYRSMGLRPLGTTLERKDSNGNYEPGNCEWATPTQQTRTRRNAISVFWKGVDTALSDVAKELGITYGAAFMRLKRGKLHDRL